MSTTPTGLINGWTASHAMSRQTISQEKILRFAVGCVVVSSVAAVVFLLFREVASVRGPAGGLGIMSALVGSSVAGWFAFRSRDRRLTVAALVSALPIAFWSWVLYDLVYDNAA